MDDDEKFAAENKRRAAAQELLQQRRLAKADIEATQKKRVAVWDQPRSAERDAEIAALDTRLKELAAQIDGVDHRLAELLPGGFGKFQRVQMANFN